MDGICRVWHPQDGGMTLHDAAAKGRIPVVELLIEKGVDVNARDDSAVCRR